MTKRLSRRDFLKQGLYFSAASLALNSLNLQAKANTNTKSLVMIYMPGGYDGAHFLAPIGDPDYNAKRPRIALQDSQLTSINGSNFFAFNNLISQFADIYNAGDMAILPAVHFDNPTRSHFSDRDRIFSDMITEVNSEGWINKLFEMNREDLGVEGKLSTFLRELPLILRGPYPVNNTFGQVQLQDYDGLIDQVKNVYEAYGTNPFDSFLKQSFLNFYGNYKDFQDVEIDNYVPDNNAQYVPYNGFDTNLIITANLIKSFQPKLIYMDYPASFDTHNGQDASFSGSLPALGANIQAFYQDLGERMNDVTVLIFSEFGRTITDNANLGTDHGYANSWFVIGKNIRGGLYGDWTGFANGVGDRGFLRPSVNIPDVFLELVSKHLGLKASGLFPGHSYKETGFVL